MCMCVRVCVCLHALACACARLCVSVFTYFSILCFIDEFHRFLMALSDLRVRVRVHVRVHVCECELSGAFASTGAHVCEYGSEAHTHMITHTHT